MTSVILAALTLSVVEIVILQLGAVILGIAIHFFLSSRRSLKTSSVETERLNKSIEDWKSKYFNEVDSRDKEISEIKERLAEAEDSSRIYRMEMEELRRQNKKLVSDLDEVHANLEYAQDALRQAETELGEAKKLAAEVPAIPVQEEKPDYMNQLRQAQNSLMEHNDKINRLLAQIDVIKEKEEQQQLMMEQNEELSNQINQLRIALGEKEKEINNIRQKEHLTREMTSMLDNAYNEFNVLQSKMQKLESQVASSKMVNVDYEDLKESHVKLVREYDEQKAKLQALVQENQHLGQQLAETEEKLKESNFQRQQLQKRVAYLEELNNDLQVLSDAHKKLEGQLKRIGELENKLNMVSEERDALLRRQGGV
jgi:DNA repair exonuclease SbcCD ATPase subunit